MMCRVIISPTILAFCDLGLRSKQDSQVVMNSHRRDLPPFLLQHDLQLHPETEEQSCQIYSNRSLPCLRCCLGHTTIVTLAHTSIVNRIIDPAKCCVDLIKSLLNAGLICDVEDMCSGDEICATGGFFHFCESTF